MAGPRGALVCPDCRAELTPERTKMNVVLDYCPKDHGIFLDPDDIGNLVDRRTQTSLHDLTRGSKKTEGACPRCRSTLRDVDLGHVRARGCPKDGSLWFDNSLLKAHVLGVRRRAYGADSMAAREDVMGEATAFYPIEVAAGILTEFQLEHEL